MHPTPESLPSTRLTALAPAKINLGLHVLRRRADGYHDLDTVFVAVGWHDTLTVAPSPSLAFSSSDPALPTDASNLVVKAALALAKHVGIKPYAALHLGKQIPYGAGLGGGSSDAATTLRALTRLWSVDVSDEALHAMAARLGSDVPFFLDPRPMHATGRGEALAPLVVPGGSAYTLPYPLVVAVPDVHVSTADAYRLVRPNDMNRADVAATVASSDLGRWRRDLVNDFEAPVVAAFPALAAVRTALTDAGAAYVSMSGSGSAFFGVFEDEPRAAAAAERLAASGNRVWHGFATSA